MLNENPNRKPGIKLPKNKEEWELANTYFQLKLNSIDISRMGVNYALYEFNKVACEYFFRDNYGQINIDDPAKNFQHTIVDSATKCCNSKILKGTHLV